MPIDPKQTWVDTVNMLPPTNNVVSGVKKFSDAVDAATTGKAQLTGITGPVRFTFQKAIFFAGLLQLSPTPDPVSGTTKFVNAWAQAIVASAMVVSPGAKFNGITWSAVASTLLDPPSLVVAQSFLFKEILTAGQNPVADAKQGKFGPALFNAFKLLTYTVTGLDTTSPPSGPLPLIAPACKLM